MTLAPYQWPGDLTEREQIAALATIDWPEAVHLAFDLGLITHTHINAAYWTDTDVLRIAGLTR